jgi:hypothetical protein
MFRTTRSLFTVLALVAFPALSFADWNFKPKPFHVYGGNCSRSIGLRGSYATVEEAITAAAKLQTEKELKHVTIRTGDMAALKADYFGRGAAEYQVYRRGVRCGIWSVHSTLSDADKVTALIKELETRLSPVAIVSVYKAKTK